MLAAVTVAVLGLAACAISDEKILRVGVDTTDPLFGVPVSVWIEGLEAGQSVSLAARSEDETGMVFQSEAIFEADGNGVVDLGKHAPASGAYEDVDALGIFWSMKPQAEPKMWRNFMFSNLPHIGVTLEAATADGEMTSAEVRWHFQDEGAEMVRVPVEEEGLRGVLWRPAGAGPFPTLILLGGSGGGVEEWWAKTMASHGYASLALAYFGYEDLPGELLEIPLESIESAIVWLDGQEAVDAERLAVIGGSKGGELALLAAATYPQIKAVVGCVASGIVWQGVHEYEVASSWSLDGQGLPYAKWFFSQEDAERFMAGESVALRNAYAIEMNDPETLDAATIPVEKINGPVLLVSGTDDQMWPSDVFGDLVMERLAANHHPHERRHLKVDGGGHLVFLPVFVTGGNRQPVPFMFGGTAEADANGSVEFWGLMLDFLNRHLGAAG
jgi:dienelactone hydrolase